MSNNGGKTEENYAQYVNKKINGTLRGDQIILCHTPLKPKDMIDNFRNQSILIISRNPDGAV